MGPRDLKKSLRLSRECRDILKRPRGPIKTSPPGEGDLKGGLLISVGDRVSRVLSDAGLGIGVAILDLKEGRIPVSPSPTLLAGRRIIEVANPSGTITREAWSAVREAIDLASVGERVGIIVEGEEDLLGFPAVILAPDGWWVAYGQPSMGMVMLRINERVRREALSLLKRCFLPL